MDLGCITSYIQLRYLQKLKSFIDVIGVIKIHTKFELIISGVTQYLCSYQHKVNLKIIKKVSYEVKITT